MNLPDPREIRKAFPWDELPTCLKAPWEGLGEKGGPILLACSGGADSIAALLFSWAWTLDYPKLSLQVIHFNHRLRGEDSEGDEQFVRDLAQLLNLTFRSGRASEVPGDGSFPSEETLRDQRHQFFMTTAREVGAVVIVTGHHLNDVLETMLMRVGRGSGTEGLAAPAALSKGPNGLQYWRPLIHLPRALIQERLYHLGVAWREDTTNTQPVALRNIIRGKVVPRWTEAIGERWVKSLQRTYSLLSEDNEALTHIATKVFRDCKDGRKLSLNASLLQQPRAVQRRILFLWFASLDQGFPAAPLMDQILESIGEDTSLFTLDERTQLKVFPDRLEVDSLGLVEKNKSVLLPQTFSLKDQLLDLSDGSRLEIKVLPLEESNDGVPSQQIGSGRDWKEVVLCVGRDSQSLKSWTVRSWLGGDVYLPMGAPGRKKLQDAFVDRKIPQELRRKLPVVCDSNGEIVWVPYLVPAEGYRLGEGKQMVLSLTYHPSQEHI